MKKRILIIILIILIVATIIGGIIFLTGDKKNNGDEAENTETLSILDISTVSEYEAFTKSLKNEHGITNDKLYATIFDFDFLGETATITYSFDGDGNIYEYDVYVDLISTVEGLEEGQEIPKPSAEELKTRTEEILTSFCKMYGCELPENIYVYNNDGTFSDCKDISAYQNLADEVGFLCFTLRDIEGSFFEFTMSYSEGLYSGTLTKHYDKDNYMEYVANISLYDEIADV